MTDDSVLRWDPWWWYRDVASTTIVAIYQDAEGFRVILNAKDCPPTRVSVAPGHLLLFRVFDESSLAWQKPSGLQPGHSFYKSESSNFLVEAKKMDILANSRPLVHYAIYTANECIDLISRAEPRFVLLREFAAGRYESERPEGTG